MRGGATRSATFGADVAEQFLAKAGFSIILRPHQAIEAGFSPDALFSARYKGAIAKVDPAVNVTFLTIEPPRDGLRAMPGLPVLLGKGSDKQFLMCPSRIFTKSLVADTPSQMTILR
jgi:hypothetical protein